MNKVRLHTFLEYLFLFLFGGTAYCLLELHYRHWTHWSMFLAGGLVFCIIGVENQKIRWEWSLVSQALVAGLTITSMEFLFGCIFNLGLHMHVWDYSKQPYNLLGQICLIWSLLWCAVGLVAVVLDDFLRWRLFGEEKPHYRLL
ncbi:MAG: putative ABC transporter permease [Oscillospiraceae bacterium]|nr:putative ABC transporter permease [Oscillospiraceae bacterium]